jgi:hypothetical protein
MLLVVESLAGHDGLWAECVRHSSSHWKLVKQFDSIEYNVDSQQLGQMLKLKAVLSHLALLLHYPDLVFNFRDVLIGTSQVDHWSTWHGLA